MQMPYNIGNGGKPDEVLRHYGGQVAPGYLDVIACPTDLRQIFENLQDKIYGKVEEYGREIFLMFDNCRHFNRGEEWFEVTANQASGSHLDLSRAPYVLYGVKYIDPVSLAPISGRDRLQQQDEERIQRLVPAKRAQRGRQRR